MGYFLQNSTFTFDTWRAFTWYNLGYLTQGFHSSKGSLTTSVPKLVRSWLCWSPLGGKRRALDLEGNPGSHTLVICPADRKFLKRDCVSSYNSQSQCITRPAREKKPSLSLFMAHAQRRNLFGEVLKRQWPTKGDKKRHQWGRRWWAGGACNCSATLNALHQLTVRAV